MSDESIRDLVKQKYGQAALRVVSGETSCCGTSPQSTCDPITSNLYQQGETADLPAEAVAASLGCGNPTALAAARSPGRRCWISGRAAASTSCSRRRESAPPARPTGST